MQPTHLQPAEEQIELIDRRELCPTCEDIRVNCHGFGPSHEGSRRCESGSLASGGRNAHCTCDTCF